MAVSLGLLVCTLTCTKEMFKKKERERETSDLTFFGSSLCHSLSNLSQVLFGVRGEDQDDPAIRILPYHPLTLPTLQKMQTHVHVATKRILHISQSPNAAVVSCPDPTLSRGKGPGLFLVVPSQQNAISHVT